jgi:hypothetical protein
MKSLIRDIKHHKTFYIIILIVMFLSGYITHWISTPQQKVDLPVIHFIEDHP